MSRAFLFCGEIISQKVRYVGGHSDMKRSCIYCGGIHEKNFECEKKPKREKKNDEITAFRNTSAWRKAREQIKRRDGNMCRWCLEHSEEIGKRRYNCTNLEVHHIIPIAEDFEKRLEDRNLITLCEQHHEMAERGLLSRTDLIKSIPPGVDALF